MRGYPAIILCALVFATVHSQWTPDLQKPVEHFKELAGKASGFNLVVLLGAALQFLGSCLPATQAVLKKHPDLQGQLETLMKEVSTSADTLTFLDDLKAYMKTSYYAEIHNHLWADEEFNDVIELFFYSGWNEEHNIYANFQKLYDILECTLTLPLGPRNAGSRWVKSDKKSTTLNPKSKSTQSQRSRPRRSLDPVTPYQQNQCNIIDIVASLYLSNITDFLPMVDYILQELNSDPSVHILFATLVEPAKGKSFCKTRNLPAVKRLIDYWNNGFKNNVLVKLVFNVLGLVLGVDFSSLDGNVIDNLISLLEFTLWRTPYGAPCM